MVPRTLLHLMQLPGISFSRAGRRDNQHFDTVLVPVMGEVGRHIDWRLARVITVDNELFGHGLCAA
jgi:hypothetical protein